MDNQVDIKITFETRGDDLDRLNELIGLIPPENTLLTSYVCYLKAEIVEQLDKLGFEISKDNYPLDHPKGYTWDEFIKEYLE